MEKFTEVMPRTVCCVLGNWSEEEFDNLKQIVNKAGFEFDEEYSQLEADDRMPMSFEVSKDRVTMSFMAEDEEAVKNHTGVAYFILPLVEDDEDLPNILGKALIFIQFLFNNLGATALKCESSGIAHGKSRWVALSEAYAKDGSMEHLYQAFVRRPIDNDYGMHSVGMHLLGFQDVFYAHDSDFETELEAVKNMDKIAQIIWEEEGDYEEIEEEIEDSDLHNNCPRLLECRFYAEDDFMYNPYGYVYVNDGE